MGWKSLKTPVNMQKWRKLRQKILKERGRRCQICDKGTGRMEIDHIIPVQKNPSLFWEEKNLQAVCRNCHILKTEKENPRLGIEARKWKKFLRETIKELS